MESGDPLPNNIQSMNAYLGSVISIVQNHGKLRYTCVPSSVLDQFAVPLMLVLMWWLLAGVLTVLSFLVL